MTTTGMPQDLGQTVKQVPRASIAREVLLACGILSSMLYIATDILGGMRYEGYSFNSQMISELMAVGAPSEAFVDPLFELPAGNGVGTARAMARAYSVFAEGGAALGIKAETFARVTAIPEVARVTDEVLGVPSYFSLGFLRPGPELSFGSSRHTFGAPGAGGSFAFADPDAHLGFAYVMNKLDFYLENDPREKSLRDAVYRAIARRAGSRKPLEMIRADTDKDPAGWRADSVRLARTV